jgi:uncharacterized secreted protein with C-terminal beta-propeller domain
MLKQDNWTNWACYGIYVRDSLAYFTARDFHIVDISNPSNIKEVGYYDPAGSAHGVYVEGNIAYVTGNLGTYVDLLILDISDPRNPEKISSFDTPGTFARKNCFVHDSYVYLSDADGGLRIIDVSSSSNPFEVGYYQTPTFLALNAFLSDPYVYVAAACLGLQIYEFYGAGIEEGPEKPIPLSSKLRLLQNPIRGDCIEVLLSSPEQNSAEISLYNQIGQKLRAYHFNALKKGENRLRLDVKGLPAGVYFLKATVSEHEDIQKLIKIR